MSKTSHGSSFRNLIAKLKTTFKIYNIDIEIKTCLISKLDLNQFYINAYYDQEAEQHNECSIEVVIYHNIKSNIVFEHSQLGQFIVQIYDAVVHEFRHKYQSHRRNFLHNTRNLYNENDALEYLSDPDELDAYALSIAIELVRSLGKSKSLQYLKRSSRLSKIRPKGLYASPTLYQYFEVFESIQHPIIQKLLKKVYLNLEQVDTTAIFY
jgi:hypothetical protein